MHESKINNVPHVLQQGYAHLVVIGEQTACGIVHNLPLSVYTETGNGSATKILCWGLCFSGVCDIPLNRELNANPMSISIGSFHVCSIYSSTLYHYFKLNKLACWGSDLSGQLNIPDELKSRV